MHVYLCVSMYMCIQVPLGSEKGVDLPGAGATGSCGCWDLNLDLLQRQYPLLTTESSLQPLSIVF